MNFHKKDITAPQVGATNVSRRAFIVGAGTTAAVTMGYAIIPHGISTSQAMASPQWSPSVLYDILASGKVVLRLTKAEMGQHVGTAFAQILADELDCKWEDIEIDNVGFHDKYGLMVTGGSWSINWTFDALSRAGAAGRKSLLIEASNRLGVDLDKLTAKDGVISGGDKSITYGDLVAGGVKARAYSEDDLKKLKLKDKSERRFVGKSMPALDIPPKVMGKADYGIDAKLPGMLYATPVNPPVRWGAKVKSVDDSAAKKIPGYVRHVVIKDALGLQTGFVMAVADSYWKASKAAKAMKVEYDLGPNAKVSFADIVAESKRIIDTDEDSRLVVNDGNLDEAAKKAETFVNGEYTTSINIHMPLEPMNATVQIKDGVYHIHAGHQFQTLVMGTVPKALGIKKEQISFHQYYLGGGFGRRLDVDAIVLACLTAKEVGNKPVKLIYSRETDTQFDYTRPAAVIRHNVGLIGKKIDCWKIATASAWATARMAPEFLAPDLSGDKKKVHDTFAVNGADHWYTVPNQRLLSSMNKVAQSATPSGELRSVGPAWQFWALESMVDEVAAKIGADPLELRLSLLDGSGKNAGKGPTKDGTERLKAALKLVAEKSGYGKKQPDGTGIGLACVTSQERAVATWTAVAADVTVNKADGTYKVNKLTIATDVGTIVSPAGVESQVMGAAMWGFSMATLEGTGMENGALQADNFDSYTPARMSDAPELDITLIPTDHYPVGCGEPATTAVGPAIGNAIFAAVGARVRSLPITSEQVKAAIPA
ncbi:MAG: molybdopterin cofactor-binding domain-containing protein [Hyphomicrobiaceae bacterium]